MDGLSAIAFGMDDRMEVLAEGETSQPTRFRRREVSRVRTDMWSDITSVGSDEDVRLGLADRLPFPLRV